jgi:hypothetical protein
MNEFGMHIILPIDKATPSTARIVEVEESTKIIQIGIKILTQIEREYLEEHLLIPCRLINMIQHDPTLCKIYSKGDSTISLLYSLYWRINH